jgi:hypothetical protein
MKSWWKEEMNKRGEEGNNNMQKEDGRKYRKE